MLAGGANSRKMVSSEKSWIVENRTEASPNISKVWISKISIGRSQAFLDPSNPESRSWTWSETLFPEQLGSRVRTRDCSLPGYGNPNLGHVRTSLESGPYRRKQRGCFPSMGTREHDANGAGDIQRARALRSVEYTSQWGVRRGRSVKDAAME